mmetsp:Transcript_104748/g.284483  ORF Transcript_104748/g.284483 Transcript_104748/m.284483 type:complete len:85 (+) Transcript_104748:212-466(+)
MCRPECTGPRWSPTCAGKRASVQRSAGELAQESAPPAVQASMDLSAQAWALQSAEVEKLTLACTISTHSCFSVGRTTIRYWRKA